MLTGDSFQVLLCEHFTNSGYWPDSGMLYLHAYIHTSNLSKEQEKNYNFLLDVENFIVSQLVPGLY